MRLVFDQELPQQRGLARIVRFQLHRIDLVDRRLHRELSCGQGGVEIVIHALEAREPNKIIGVRELLLKVVVGLFLYFGLGIGAVHHDDVMRRTLESRKIFRVQARPMPIAVLHAARVDLDYRMRELRDTVEVVFVAEAIVELVGVIRHVIDRFAAGARNQHH